MNLPPASPTYSRDNEQAARNAMAAEDIRNRKVDVAVPFILLTDSDTGETGKLTIESGVIVWTAL